MIRAPHRIDRTTDPLKHSPASGENALETTEFLDLPLIWDDCGLAELFQREEGAQRDALLSQITHLMISSLSGYQELEDLAANSPLHSLAEVIVRQRGAQCRELLVDAQHWIPEPEEGQELLAALRSAWRLALWNFEQHNHDAVMAYAERAESLLEDACLAAANVLENDAWGPKLREIALTIYGARNRWEEYGDRLADHAEGDTVAADELVMG